MSKNIFKEPSPELSLADHEKRLYALERRLATVAGGGGGSSADASTTVKGISKLSVAPALSSNPIAVGDNDTRMTNARTPTAHAASHGSAGSDPITVTSAMIQDGTIVGTDLASAIALPTAATATTQAAGDASTKIATDEFVQRELGNPVTTRPVFKAYVPSNQPITANTWANVSWTEIYDTDTMHSDATNPTRIVATTPGYYLVNFKAIFAATATGITIAARVERFNGAGVSQEYIDYDETYSNAKSVSEYDTFRISSLVNMNAGDYLVCEMYCNVAHNILGGATNVPCTMVSVTFEGNTGAAWGNASVSLYNPLVSGAATVGTGGETPIDTWQTEAYDNGGMHDPVTNPGRITIQTPGLYEIKARVWFVPVATTGTAYASIYKNGSLIAVSDPVVWWNNASFFTSCQVDYDDTCVAGDYFSVAVYQSTGATRTFATGAGRSVFQAKRVGYMNPGNDKTVVATLPSNPSHGQECYYQSAAMATDGVVWHLKYNANSSSAYKWEYVGGQPLVHEIDATDSNGVTTGSYNDLTNVGPQLTTPLAGDYMLTYGCNTYGVTNNITTWMSPKIGAAATADADSIAVQNLSTAGTRPTTGNYARNRRKTALAASTLIKLQYKADAANGDWNNRWLNIVPIRVG